MANPAQLSPVILCGCTKRRMRVRDYSDAVKVQSARLIRPLRAHPASRRCKRNV